MFNPEFGKSEQGTEDLSEKPIEKLVAPEVVEVNVFKVPERPEDIEGQIREVIETVNRSFTQEDELYDPFKSFAVSEDGKRIELPQEKADTLRERVSSIQRGNRFAAPGLIRGNPTARDYIGGEASNYSTRTHLEKLPSGEKFIVIDRYPLTTVHTFFNNTMERLTGFRSHKVGRREWKPRYQERTNIPLVDIGDNPYAVVMPYVENVNLRDWFGTDQKDIREWQGVDWAKDNDLEKKKGVLSSIVRELERVQAQVGGGWGNMGLENMIMDPNGKIYICDPESKFDADVPVDEQKAADLKDVIYTAASMLAKSENFTNFAEVVKLVFDNYSDRKAVSKAIEAANKKPSLINGLFFGYTQVRFGLKDFKMHEEIRNAIASYSLPELEPHRE